MNEKEILQSTFTDACRIFDYKKTKVNGITELKPVLSYKDVRCALSQKTLKTTNQSEGQNEIDYEMKLFLNPDTLVKPGGRIEVLRLGREYVFESVGEPIVYPSHQEVLLRRKERA